MKKKNILMGLLVASSFIALTSCGKEKGKDDNKDTTTIVDTTTSDTSNSDTTTTSAQADETTTSTQGDVTTTIIQGDVTTTEADVTTTTQGDITTTTQSEEDGLTHVEAKNATCEEDGNIEYWYNEKTNEYFSDANGENPIELSDTIIKAHHEFVETDKTTTTSKFVCSNCNDTYYHIDDIYFKCDYTPATESAEGECVFKAYSYDALKNEFTKSKFIINSVEHEEISYVTPILTYGDKYTLDFNNNTVSYNKVELIRNIKEVIPSLGLKDAKDFVDKYLTDVFTTPVSDAEELHKKSEYTITYYRYNTETKVNDIIKTFKANGKDGFVVEALERDYYTLLGYDAASPGSKLVYSIGQNIIPNKSTSLYTYEKHVDVDVTFIPKTGTSFVVKATEGKITMPDFEEEYYYDHHLVNWRDNDNNVYTIGEEYIIDEPITLKPRLAINTYSTLIDTIPSTVEHDGYNIYECDQVAGRTKEITNTSDLRKNIGYGYVEDKYNIPGRGTAVTMTLANGIISVGESAELLMKDGTVKSTVITGIEIVSSHKYAEEATPATGKVALLLRGISDEDREAISVGDLLCESGKAIKNVKEIYVRTTLYKEDVTTSTLSKGYANDIVYDGSNKKYAMVSNIYTIKGTETSTTQHDVDYYVKLTPADGEVFLTWIGEELKYRTDSNIDLAEGTVVARSAEEFNNYLSNKCDIRIYKNDGTDEFKVVSVNKTEYICDMIPPFEREGYYWRWLYSEQVADEDEEIMDLFTFEDANYLVQNDIVLYVIWQEE